MTNIVYQRLTIEGKLTEINELIKEIGEGEKLNFSNILSSGYEYLDIDNRIYIDWYKENNKQSVNFITEYIDIEPIIEYLSRKYPYFTFNLLYLNEGSIVVYGNIFYEKGLLCSNEELDNKYMNLGDSQDEVNYKKIRKVLEVDKVQKSTIYSLINNSLINNSIDDLDPNNYSKNGFNEQ